MVKEEERKRSIFTTQTATLEAKPICHCDLLEACPDTMKMENVVVRSCPFMQSHHACFSFSRRVSFSCTLYQISTSFAIERVAWHGESSAAWQTLQGSATRVGAALQAENEQLQLSVLHQGWANRNFPIARARTKHVDSPK